MKIETIKVKNFRAFKDMEMRDIPRFCVIAGANGTGKSTLFQLFGFLKTALKDNVRIALNKLGGARGFEEVRTRNSDGPIEITLKFREEPSKPLITYELAINVDENKRPFVEREGLKYRRGSKGKPWHFLKFDNGEGYAVTNEVDLDKIDDETSLTRDFQSLKSPDILAIKGLAQFEKFRAVRALGDLVEKWYVSDFHITEARLDSEADYAEHLSETGDNLPLVTQYLYGNHSEILDRICKRLSDIIPGLGSVEPKLTDEGKVLLKYRAKDFNEPFLSRYVSDGTIKAFAYLVLLNDPKPYPLLCVEEPENQLYPTLLQELAEEFRAYSERGEQVFVSTHSYEFLNAAQIDEVFWLVKKGGVTTVKRASNNKEIQAMMRNNGDKMGRLWREGFFEGAEP